jgi:hypothetical protein
MHVARQPEEETMRPLPSDRKWTWLRLALWFVLTLLFLGAARVALRSQFILFGPPVELTRSEWLSYNVPPIVLFVLSLLPLFWPKPSPQMVAFGVIWFFLGGFVLLFVLSLS